MTTIVTLYILMQIGIATKYFGPIILSISSMLQDVFLFLITFCVIMVAFGCGVSFIFNMASGEDAEIVKKDCPKLSESRIGGAEFTQPRTFSNSILTTCLGLDIGNISITHLICPL